MASFPNTTQSPVINNSCLSNGLPSQMQQNRVPMEQNVITSSVGINKYLSPGTNVKTQQPTFPPQLVQTTIPSVSGPLPSIHNSNVMNLNFQHKNQQEIIYPQASHHYLTNGSSTHSSRTGSPALNNSQNQPAISAENSLPEIAKLITTENNQFRTSNIQQQTQVFQPNTTMVTTPNTGREAFYGNQHISASMQNLNLGQPNLNGPSNSIKHIHQSPKSKIVSNFTTNFNTSGLNLSNTNIHQNAHETPNINTDRRMGANVLSTINAFPHQGHTNTGTNGVPMNSANTRPPTNTLNTAIRPMSTTNYQQANNMPFNPNLGKNLAISQPPNQNHKLPNASLTQHPQRQHEQQQSQQQQQQQQPQQQNSRKLNARPPMIPDIQQPYSQAYHQPFSTPQYQSQQSYGQMSVTQQGFNKLWGQETIDLMQHRHILPHDKVQPPRIILNNQIYESVNCNPDIMRCTLTKIPESNNLLQKSRLPLGILIHPFRDINSLPVIQCPNIVRCRLCRTYINPFVYFVDNKMWKCNLCYRINELPEDFQYDPASKTYGDVNRRPEIRSSTIEFIAPSEYMLRPPQPAIYLFLFDVSILAQQSGYLEAACSVLSKHLDDMPGDARTQVGFIAYNSEIHFYNIAEGYNQPHEMTLVDIEDAFLPCPDNLLINLNECKELIKDLLNQLPIRFADSHDPGSALGAALQVAFKLMSASGGRITVFQTCLPNKGPGALQAREDPNNRSSKEVLHLNPATDFYKRQALECSGQQIAVDVFLLNQQYSDLATLSGISKYSGGSIYHFPLYQNTKPQIVDSFKQCFKRYLTRKIGFEAVMRIRCTRGLQIHTFHGNFFVRSTDLLSLPNVNPDAGYGMQISYEESLTDIKTICFQAALLYTNSEGERRIRVHTLCLPVTSNLSEVMHSADSQCIVGLLSKMAVDRSFSSNIGDARDAFINATVDIVSAFKLAQNLPAGQTGQLIVPRNLSLLPLYILALLKNIAFRTGTSTRLDDRIAAMDAMKTLPLDQLMKFIYPEYYLIDCLFYNNNGNDNEDTERQQYPLLLQLSAEYIDSRSMFLLDCGALVMIFVGLNVPPNILESVLGIQSTAEIPDYCYGLPTKDTPENELLRTFISNLNDDKPYAPTIQIIRDTSTCRAMFLEKLVDDRSESSLSYYEFLQHLRTQVK